MDSIASGLNLIIEDKPVFHLLSEFGKKIYFPKGIISQSSEARKKAWKYNATIGMAMENRQPMFLPSVKSFISGLELSEIFAYAPTAGIDELRRIWKREMIVKNPSLAGKKISDPIVTAGLTHGLSLASDLFIDRGESVMIPDMYWGNYKLIFSLRREAEILNFPFFDDDYRFNCEALKKTLSESRGEKAVLLLNFPNNPTGYSLSRDEQGRVVDILVKAAEKGKNILVICDDSYFGLFFEDSVEPNSIFASLCDAHDNITAVKIDGATKEEFVWGFRVGFITYGGKALDKASCDVLEQKTEGAVRSSVSSCSSVSQNLLLRGLKSSSYLREKREAAEKMKRRYRAVKEILASDEAKESSLIPLPVNSGYFMSFASASSSGTEQLRRYLLEKYGIGTVSIDDRYLRVAFSSVDERDIKDLFLNIFKASKELNGRG